MPDLVLVITFSVLHWKDCFCANLVQKIKIVNLNCNVVPRLIWIWRSWCWCSHCIQMWSKMLKLSVYTKIWCLEKFKYRIQCCSLLFSFQPEIPFLSKFCPKIQNCQLKLKFGSYSNIQLAILGKFGSKNKKCWFKLKLCRFFWGKFFTRNGKKPGMEGWFYNGGIGSF